MDLGLIHAVNIGKMSLEEAQKKEKGTAAPKPSKAAAKSDKTTTPTGK